MSIILAVNAGSSSLKISLYRRALAVDDFVKLILVANISDISGPPVTFIFNGVKVLGAEINDHVSAFAHFLERLDPDLRKEIKLVCHRVVHGGDMTNRAVIDETSYHHIAALSDLAPLHNGAALSVIKACIDQLPNAKSVAYFDTTFHQSIPHHIASYPIDQTTAKSRGLKKYGFHGLSYEFTLRSVSQFLGKPPGSLNLIVLHLGSGASVCAIQRGKSLDTSMGFTPASGLPGATRSGNIDPSVIFHYADWITSGPCMSSESTMITRAEEILNRKAGWKALTGTVDFRVISEKAETALSDDDPHRLAFNIFVDRILDFVGSYHLKLGGNVDALVFAGGIGERSQRLRWLIAEKTSCLGYATVDPEKNEKPGEGVVVDITEDEPRDSRRIFICRTDEQVEMARACASDKEFFI